MSFPFGELVAQRVFVNARPPTHLDLSDHCANASVSSTKTSPMWDNDLHEIPI